MDEERTPSDPALESILAPLEAGHRVDLNVLDSITVDMMDARTPGDGMSVAQHFAHVVGSTKFWVSCLSEAAVADLPDLYDDDRALDAVVDAFKAERDPARVRYVLTRTHAALLGAIREAHPGTGRLPHRSLALFAAHMLVHDAHHRGQVLLALKTNDLRLPDEQLVWGPWKA